VTWQHVIAEVIGQLPDEFGMERQELQQVSENEFLVDAALPIHEMRALAGLVWKHQDVTTVGGYVVRRIGHLPRVGEQLRIDGYIVTVEQADDRRVRQLSFRRA
jgi:CBS domain containing-hemolysin-like protein